MYDPITRLFIVLTLLAIVIVFQIISKFKKKKESEKCAIEDEYSYMDDEDEEDVLDDSDYEDEMFEMSKEILNRIEALEIQNKEIMEKLENIIWTSGNQGKKSEK